jgi:hypothetical protein
MKYDVESFHGEVVRLEKIICSSGHPWSKYFFKEVKRRHGQQKSFNISAQPHSQEYSVYHDWLKCLLKPPDALDCKSFKGGVDLSFEIMFLFSTNVREPNDCFERLSITQLHCEVPATTTFDVILDITHFTEVKYTHWRAKDINWMVLPVDETNRFASSPTRLEQLNGDASH